MYHQKNFKSRLIKMFITVVALSSMLAAANTLNSDEEQRRTARTSYAKKKIPFETQKTTARSFLDELDLFVRVLLSGPFGLYHGWRMRNHKQQTKRF